MSPTLPLEKERILLVDDQPANIQVLAEILRKDYDILVANNGPTALEIATGKEPPDLILLDIEMPQMDGYEVFRQLQTLVPDLRIPVIFVTARDHMEDEEKGISLGAVDYISKPFHPAIIKARVKNQLDRRRIENQLAYEAMHDPLTGVFNRRAILQALERESLRAQREGSGISIAMIDLDHFKAINDEKGHSVGDEVLMGVVATIKSSLRGYDLLGRFGGDEFLVICPSPEQKQGTAVFQRICAVASQTRIDTTAGTIPITLSIGTAWSDGRLKVDELLRRADQALYKAKENRACCVEMQNNLEIKG